MAVEARFFFLSSTRSVGLLSGTSAGQSRWGLIVHKGAGVAAGPSPGLRSHMRDWRWRGEGVWRPWAVRGWTLAILSCS